MLALLIFFIYLILFLIPGNHQICRLVNQQHTLHCQWDLPVRYHRGDIFENVDYVQVFFLFSSGVTLFLPLPPSWFFVYLISKIYDSHLRFWVSVMFMKSDFIESTQFLHEWYFYLPKNMYHIHFLSPCLLYTIPSWSHSLI